jgi:hypothetical protein
LLAVYTVLAVIACQRPDPTPHLAAAREWRGTEELDSLGYVVHVEDGLSGGRILAGSPNLTNEGSLDGPRGGAYILSFASQSAATGGGRGRASEGRRPG